MRIGELARRTGVPAATLRAWERRYGLLQPRRTPGGQRVYAAADVLRVRQVLARVEAGARVSEAVEAATQPSDPPPAANELARGLWDAVDAFDERSSWLALSTAVGDLGVGPALDHVVVPVLRRLGDEWRLAARNVGREHFASTIARAFLVQSLRAEDTARRGPRCLAFCPEGEQHDLGVVMAAVALAEAGWHPILLGAQTPWPSVVSLLAELRPEVVLVGSQRRPPAVRLLAAWDTRLVAGVVLGGAGFTADDALALPRARYHGGPYGGLAAAVASAMEAGGEPGPR